MSRKVELKTASYNSRCLHGPLNVEGHSSDDTIQMNTVKRGMEKWLNCLAVDFAHDDVDAADDGGDIGDEAAPAEHVTDAQVAETAGLGADTQRDIFLGVAADHVEAHLTARAFGLDIGLAGRQMARRFDPVRTLGRRIFLQRLVE